LKFQITHAPTHDRRIVFKPDLTLDLTPPPSPEELEARQLAAELLSQPVNDWTTAYLQETINPRRPRPGALLRRLRELKKRGLTFQNVTLLARALFDLHWI